MTDRAWKAYRLLPDDVLFFRDGKPSIQGEDHLLRSLFPPNPTTLYGAVRTRRLMDAGIDLKGLRKDTWETALKPDLLRELGPWGGFGELEIRGPWLVCPERGVLVPAPHDLGVSLVERRAGAAPPEWTDAADAADAAPSRAARPSAAYAWGTPGRATYDRPPSPPRIARLVRYRMLDPAGDGGWSHRLAPLSPFRKGTDGWEPWQPEPGATDPRPAVAWFLTAGGLAAWASGGLPEAEHLVHASELWTDEARTGLGLTAGTRYSEESMLYTFGFIRLRPGVALGFELRGADLAPRGALRLGGEGRAVGVEPGPAFPSPPSILRARALAAPPSGERYRASFATPGYAKGGSLPRALLPGTPRAGVVLGADRIGGWDMARHRPKPLRRTLPAGSTFILDPEGGAENSASLGSPLETVWGANLTDNDNLSRQGFGLTLVGLYD